MLTVADKMRALTPTKIEPTFEWDSVCRLFPFLSGLENCRQDRKHHAEGNVGVHTRMVIDALLNSAEWPNLDDDGRFRLFWTAVFHDCGKPGTTIEEGKTITSRGHSKLGAYITRETLRAANVDLLMREQICNLILAHQKPFFLFGSDEATKTACKFSLLGDASDLILHAKSDAIGRECEDKDDLLERVALSQVVFEDLGILTGGYPFETAESRVAYFERDDRDLHHVAYEDFRCEATLVCGLPGSGKDTYISQHLDDLPCVSLDNIRLQMKMKHDDNQGVVRQAALEEARTHLRAGRDFVWNAVNTSDLNRSKVTQLLREYNARIRIIYLEVDPKRLLAQNGQRKAAVPVPAIDRLIKKLSPPSPTEAHEVQWLFNGEKVFEIGSPSQQIPVPA